MRLQLCVQESHWLHRQPMLVPSNYGIQVQTAFYSRRSIIVLNLIIPNGSSFSVLKIWQVVNRYSSCESSSANSLYTLLQSLPLHLSLSSAFSNVLCTTSAITLFAPTSFPRPTAISITPLHSSVENPPSKSLADAAVDVTP